MLMLLSKVSPWAYFRDYTVLGYQGQIIHALFSGSKFIKQGLEISGNTWATIEILCYFSRGARVSFGLGILKVECPARNLHILNPEVVLITAWGARFGNQREYYGLPLTSMLFSEKFSHQDHPSLQNIQVFSWALDAPIISLNNTVFLSNSWR